MNFNEKCFGIFTPITVGTDDLVKFTHNGRVYPSIDIIASTYLGDNKLSIIGEEFDGEVDLITLEGWLFIPTDENGKAHYFAETAFR